MITRLCTKITTSRDKHAPSPHNLHSSRESPASGTTTTSTPVRRPLSLAQHTYFHADTTIPTPAHHRCTYCSPPPKHPWSRHDLILLPARFLARMTKAAPYWRRKPARKHPTRKTRSRDGFGHDAYASANWRNSHFWQDGGSAFGDEFGVGFSEESIARQLGYMDVGAWRDQGRSGAKARYSYADQRRRFATVDREGCCWHTCAWSGWVWCCGGSCCVGGTVGVWSGEHGGGGGDDDGGVDARGDVADGVAGQRDEGAHESSLEVQKSDELGGVPALERNESMSTIESVMSFEEPSDVSGVADMGKSSMVETSCSIYAEETRRGTWRDEWECDFCGQECFCWTVDSKIGLDTNEEA
ncbi:hypothetical protein FB567DRAFT_330530 [Paraphoma chrysanthemicola]|uniref:Uncharacterized protein n=1 Tax=Paraphoma chrysanthemicola TaxID=798071 RepID=A0A8K0R6U9_9PLEO|nr:hypothetical protein FB567DRAFT_330530 [Paraphoma chrysanthemicola]